MSFFSSLFNKPSKSLMTTATHVDPVCGMDVKKRLATWGSFAYW